MKNLFLLSKPNFKWLLSFCLIGLKNAFYCLLIVCAFSQMGYAQTTCTTGVFSLTPGPTSSQTTNNVATAHGQVFTACQDGILTSIELLLDPNNTSTDLVNVWLGAFTGPTTPVPTSNPPNETFSATSGVNDMGQAPVVINLTTPFPVVSGSLYFVEFGSTTTTALRTDAFNAAVGTGGFFRSSTSAKVDPRYDTNVQFIITAPPADVPTLSQWGLIILALMFMTMGTLYLIQPNMEEKIG